MDDSRQRREPRKPLRLILHSTPHTVSNIWMRLFEKHPDLSVDTYFLHSACRSGPERIFNALTPLGREEMETCKNLTYRNSFQTLLDFVTDAESENKSPFFKDHIHSVLRLKVLTAKLNTPNPKLAGRPEPVLVSEGRQLDNISESDSLPLHSPFHLLDSFVSTLAPAIMIRHPARVVPSAYLGCKTILGFEIHDEQFKMLLCLPWLQTVYEFWADYYKESDEKWPIVINADDLIKDPEGVVGKFCERVGIDEAGVKYEMEPLWDENLSAKTPAIRFMTAKAAKSTGLLRNEALREPVIEEEEKKWEELHGKDTATAMRKLVDEFMEDYEYLSARKL